MLLISELMLGIVVAELVVGAGGRLLGAVDVTGSSLGGSTESCLESVFSSFGSMFNGAGVCCCVGGRLS